jgi:hypothetical protein
MNIAIKRPRKPKKASSPSRPESNLVSGVQQGQSNEIARKAYQLWEQRGRQDGSALRDWLDAEAIVMEQGHEDRK